MTDWRCRDCDRSNDAGADFCAFCGAGGPGDELRTFRLEVRMGNAEMVLPLHLADALRRAADRIEGDAALGGVIADANGNTVGSFGLGELPDGEAV